MIDEETIKKQIGFALEEADFEIGEKYKGKVRENYMVEDKIIMITTDRISAFDRVLGTIPFKGQILNQIAVFWFDKTEDIVKNHIIDVPDPNVMVVTRCKPFAVELIVREYITGSLWREYEKGGRDMYGLKFPEGLKKNQKLEKPILTPTTKAEYGEHDMPISRDEIIAKNIVPKETYEKMEQIALKLFERGKEIAAKQGLILVDTKYEIGEKDGEIIIVDEIHTPDSSRYWIKDTYQQKFDAGEEPDILDKEFVRNWLRERGFMGDGDVPELAPEVKIELAKRYIQLYEKVTGQEFRPESGDVKQRIYDNLKKKGYA